MKFALSWLKEYVDFDDTIAGLADKLTFAGLEVEHIETLGGTFEGVVVGEVKQIEPHPDADKLRLCTVEYGTAETLRVVYGKSAAVAMDMISAGISSDRMFMRASLLTTTG